jgi:hypothetical protein
VTGDGLDGFHQLWWLLIARGIAVSVLSTRLVRPTATAAWPELPPARRTESMRSSAPGGGSRLSTVNSCHSPVTPFSVRSARRR